MPSDCFLEQLSWVLKTAQSLWQILEWVSESCSVTSDSLWPHGVLSPWNSPGQNTGIGSLSLLQGIFPTQGSNPGIPHCRQILYQLSYQLRLILNSEHSQHLTCSAIYPGLSLCPASRSTLVSFVSEGRAANKLPGKFKQHRSLSPKCFSENIPSVPESMCMCSHTRTHA